MCLDILVDACLSSCHHLLHQSLSRYVRTLVALSLFPYLTMNQDTLLSEACLFSFPFANKCFLSPLSQSQVEDHYHYQHTFTNLARIVVFLVSNAFILIYICSYSVFSLSQHVCDYY